MKRSALLALLAGTALLSMTAGYVLAQQNPIAPAEVLASIDLGLHFDSMQGKVMELRLGDIAPHSSGKVHSHKGQPEVMYVLKGSVVEHQGAKAQTYHAGEGFNANADLSVPHQIENTGDTPAVLLVVEIVTPAKK